MKKPKDAPQAPGDPTETSPSATAGLGSPECPLCLVQHWGIKCNAHRKPIKTGSLPIQCGRRANPDGYCWGHDEHSDDDLYSKLPDLERKTPAPLRKAQEVVKKTMRFVSTMETPPELGEMHRASATPIENPAVALAKIAGILMAAFEEAGARVNALSGLSVMTLAGGEQLRGEVLVWEKLIGHLRGILVDMSKLNLDERLVRLEERRADMVAEALFWFQMMLVKELELDTMKRAVVDRLMEETVTRIVAMGEPIEVAQPVIRGEIT